MNESYEWNAFAQHSAIEKKLHVWVDKKREREKKWNRSSYRYLINITVPEQKFQMHNTCRDFL